MKNHRFDFVDFFALLLLVVGLGIMGGGILMEPPGSLRELFLIHFGDWTPGLIIDGVLLLVLNRVIQDHERKRVTSQVASLSNEFALDAVRRCRDEGWLQSGMLAGGSYRKARLAGADLSDARFSGADLGFADLSTADLTHADLRGANLSGANLTGADLRWANLTGADLRWADLRDAELEGAELAGVKTDFASVDAYHRELPGFQRAMIGGFLTEREVSLVRDSFQQLLEHGDSAVIRFYENLFERQPDLRALFSTDVERQARKFLQSLKVIVTSLGSTDRAAPVLQRLGVRHEGYGVRPEHYEIVGSVLLDTLDEILGDAFSRETREAWASAFGLISSVMREARTG